MIKQRIITKLTKSKLLTISNNRERRNINRINYNNLNNGQKQSKKQDIIKQEEVEEEYDYSNVYKNQTETINTNNQSNNIQEKQKKKGNKHMNYKKRIYKNINSNPNNSIKRIIPQDKSNKIKRNSLDNLDTRQKNLIELEITTQKNVNKRNLSENIFMCGKINEKTDVESVNRKLITKGIITNKLKNLIKKELTIKINNKQIIPNEKTIDKIANKMNTLLKGWSQDLLEVIKKMKEDYLKVLISKLTFPMLSD
jgi:hypothetical protein